mmetsp:Transcript_1858/g.3348  ORF Transcript_1858/g.3348 Transcript_1858/m.3348 type:complete len:85 (+) Transcript_1858:104-358(+)
MSIKSEACGTFKNAANESLTITVGETTFKNPQGADTAITVLADDAFEPSNKIFSFKFVDGSWEATCTAEGGHGKKIGDIVKWIK